MEIDLEDTSAVRVNYVIYTMVKMGLIIIDGTLGWLPDLDYG